MQNKYKYSRIKGNTIWQVESNSFGPFYFTFDKIKIYNFWTDYWVLSDKERQIFDKEYPVMAQLKNPNVIVPNYDVNEDYSEPDIEMEYSE